MGNHFTLALIQLHVTPVPDPDCFNFLLTGASNTTFFKQIYMKFFFFLGLDYNVSPL